MSREDLRLVLDVLAAAAWPALEQTELEGWLLRASAGVTLRANSALPLAQGLLSSTAPLDDLLGAVEDFYDARLLPPRVQVGNAELDAELAARGWTGSEPVDVLVGPLPGGPAPVPGLVVEEAPGEQWLDCWWAVDGRGGEPEREVARRMLARVAAPAGYASVVEDGRAVAVGRGVVQDGWLGVFAMAVLPEARRRGLGRRVLAGLGGWAAQHGGERTYLQVRHDNAPALALYAGMRPASSYRYRTRPG